MPPKKPIPHIIYNIPVPFGKLQETSKKQRRVTFSYKV
ncbi:hypothetical protein [Oscillospiraceae bacterium]|nr:hypothetical protein [Oscillospiraceae bacterium]